LSHSKVIRHCWSSDTPPPHSQTDETLSIFETSLITSSPPNTVVLCSANTALNQLVIAQEPLNTPVRQFIPRLTKTSERLQAQISILQHQNEEMRRVLGARAQWTSGKRVVTKDQFLFSTPEIYQGVKDAEKQTMERKIKVPRKGHKLQAIELPSSEDEDDIPRESFE